MMFSVTADRANSYQWQVGGSDINGATSSSLTLRKGHGEACIGGIAGLDVEWEGKLDGLRVYDRDLNATEIVDLVNDFNGTLAWSAYEDFNDNDLNATKWDTAYFYGGVGAVEVNGRVELKGNASTGNDPSRVPPGWESAVAGIPSNEGNSLIYLKDKSIYGMETEIMLPSAGNVQEAGVFISGASLAPGFRSFGVELAWRANGVKFSIDYTDPDTGQEVSIYRPASLDTTYRFAVINTGTRAPPAPTEKSAADVPGY